MSIKMNTRVQVAALVASVSLVAVITAGAAIGNLPGVTHSGLTGESTRAAQTGGCILLNGAKFCPVP